MAWVVDTCLLLDIGLDDPQFAVASESLLKDKAGDGLIISPVTFVEIAPAFGGQIKAMEQFLLHLGITYRQSGTWEETKTAALAWSQQIQKRRAGGVTKRPVADVLIGAFACQFQGLLTRNRRDFQVLFPELLIVEPGEG